MNSELPRNKSRRYSLVTSLKFMAMEEAIRLNPFESPKLAWHDPWVYRHTHMTANTNPHLFGRVQYIPGARRHQNTNR